MNLEDVTIQSQKRIARDIYEIKVSGDMVSDMRTPGQFVHIKVDDSIDNLLRRPISICDVDSEQNILTMIYRAEGSGTRKLSTYAKGASINVLGPLGNGYSIQSMNEGQTAILVGGGIGVPPLYYLSKQLKSKGIKVIHILGFSSEEDVFYEKEFGELGETYIATVDGSKGTRGFVTDVIDQLQISYDAMFACGPIPMLSALEKNYSDKPLFLSLEQRMGCGIGACMACVCHVPNDSTQTQYRKVCCDGPVFAAGEVVIA